MVLLNLDVSGSTWLLAQALFFMAAGLLLGFLVRKLSFRIIDNYIFKKLFAREVSSYDTSLTVNKIFCWIIQIGITLIFFNYAFSLLNFSLISDISSYIVNKLPQITIFLLILLSGLLVAKIVSSLIKSKKIDKKEEIAFVVEFIIFTAFILTALEYSGIKATALIELFKGTIYLIIALILILLIKPSFLKKSK